MWEMLRDPVWQGIGAVIGVAGIVSTIILGVVLYRLQRRRKELGYRVLSQTRVVSVEAELAERVQVLYEGRLVSDVHLVVVEIVNWGNQPIVAQDYEHPLGFHTGETSRILTAELTESEPDGLPASPTISQTRHTVTVDPLLLNPGDTFKVRILVSDFGGTVEVATRIEGVKKVTKLHPDWMPLPFWVSTVQLLAPISGLVGMLVLLLDSYRPLPHGAYRIGGLGVLLMFALQGLYLTARAIQGRRQA